MNIDIEYNSQREPLRISEYGRYIQKLVHVAKKIENRDERQASVEKIIQLMFLLQPNAKTYEDYKERLWKHIYIIAEFDLDVTPPVGITFSDGEYFKKPPHIAYPESNSEYRNYGKHIKSMIQKAILMEDQNKKQAFTQIIASFMKLSYSTWNKDENIGDNIILNDLRIISKGQLKLEGEYDLDFLANANPKRKFISNQTPISKISNKRRNYKHKRRD